LGYILGDFFHPKHLVTLQRNQINDDDEGVLSSLRMGGRTQEFLASIVVILPKTSTDNCLRAALYLGMYITHRLGSGDQIDFASSVVANELALFGLF
jgi:hypothetical protein